MTKHLGMIALGLALTLGLATASWANGVPKQKANGAAAPATNNWTPIVYEPDRCFVLSPWGYQWVCG